MNLPALKLATERLQKVLDPTANKEGSEFCDKTFSLFAFCAFVVRIFNEIWHGFQAT
jgi:hypothetical protein